ncbi:MAG: RDD family protein [bacterium]
MNSHSQGSPEIEKEKKKNLKLAVGVGALGIVGFMLLYAALTALIFLKPGLIFSLMPIPSLSRNVAVIDDTVYMISREFDFREYSFELDQKPKERYLLSVVNGNKLSVVQEIDPYNALVQAHSKIYFLNDGRYRIFDGKAWTEAGTGEIGSNPKGVSNPDGLFVLSLINQQPALRFIGERVTADIPLPDENREELHDNFCSSRLLWHQGRLILYWTGKNSLFWTFFDGVAWSPVAVSESSGTVEAVVDDSLIYLVHEYRSGQERVLDLSSFENGAWSDRKRLAIKTLFVNWALGVRKGASLLLVQNLFSDDLYTIEKAQVVGPVRIGRPWFDTKFIGTLIVLASAGNLLLFLIIFLVSVLIGKYKLSIGKAGEREYEFASLFRRFAAKFVDTVIIMLPAALWVFFLLRGESVWSNPFKALALGALIFLYIVLGGFLYHSLLEGLVGKTIGKKMCGIAVLRDDFSKCGILAGLLRNVMRVVDGMFYHLVGVVAMVGTLRWQRLGDIVAGTVVVRDKKTD